MRESTKKPNKTKKVNKAIIQKALHKHFKKHDVVPTLQELSEATGIGTQTISGYMSEMTLPSSLETYKFVTDDVMKWIMKASEAGNAQAQKLFFQLVWNWRPPKYNDPGPKSAQNSTVYRIVMHEDYYKNNPEYIHKNDLKPKHKTQQEILNDRNDEQNMLMSNLAKLKGDSL